MKNWKTSLPAILAAVTLLAVKFGWISEAQAGTFTTALLAVIGLFAKDNDVTGGSREQ